MKTTNKSDFIANPGISMIAKPSLNLDSQELERVVNRLSGDSDERKAFLIDPKTYLNSNKINVTSPNFVTSTHARTSEACTEIVACAYYIFVAAYSSLVVAAAYYLVAGVKTYVATYGMNIEEHMINPNEFGSIGGNLV